MAGIISFIYNISPLIIVVLGLGIMFRIIKLKSVLFYLLFLLLLPFLLSSVYHAVSSGFSSIDSWEEAVVVIFILLIAARLFIDRFFRR